MDYDAILPEMEEHASGCEVQQVHIHIALMYPINVNILDYPLAQEVLTWVSKQQGAQPKQSIYCPTRDIFISRSDRLLQNLISSDWNQGTASLLHAVIGEIGNNSYDHNLGNWSDIIGLYFDQNNDHNPNCIVLADRGQGLFTTLSPIVSNIKNDEDAIKTAFLERISGRSPEQRGNGLKFVRSIVLDDGINMLFQSGNAQYIIQDKKEKWLTVDKHIKGCLAILTLSS